MTVYPPEQLNGKGRCCGRKPIVYKRDPHLFCARCCRAYDPLTLKQISNWAWLQDGDGFVPKYPESDYRPGRGHR